MIQISALRSRLEKQPTDLRPYASFIRDDALARRRQTQTIQGDGTPAVSDSLRKSPTE
jgi:hypothetical protein